MATQLVSPITASPRQFTLRNMMVWIGVLGFFWAIPSFFPPLTVGAILSSVVYVGFILRRVTGSLYFRNVPMVLVLLYCGQHLLLTGSPFPIYHIERLHSPVAVKQVDKDVLQLADGRRVHLPLIKEIPANDVVFNTALQHGVEVTDGGDVIGLIQWPRFCGNDPVTYRLQRIDLTELAATLHPAGIDDGAVPADEISRLVANQSTWGTNGRLPIYTLHEVQRILSKRE